MTLSLQFFSLLLMMVSGILIGAIIEGTRFLTEAFPKRSFVFKYRVGLEVIIWISLGLATFYLLYEIRDGIWRVYDPLAQLVGILLYEQLFQPVFRLAGRIFIRLIVKPVWLIFRVLVTILRKILRLLKVIITLIIRPFHFLYKKIMNFALSKKSIFRYNKKYTKN